MPLLTILSNSPDKMPFAMPKAMFPAPIKPILSCESISGSILIWSKSRGQIRATTISQILKLSKDVNHRTTYDTFCTVTMKSHNITPIITIILQDNQSCNSSLTDWGCFSSYMIAFVRFLDYWSNKTTNLCHFHRNGEFHFWMEKIIINTNTGNREAYYQCVLCSQETWLLQEIREHVKSQLTDFSPSPLTVSHGLLSCTGSLSHINASLTELQLHRVNNRFVNQTAPLDLYLKRPVTDSITIYLYIQSQIFVRVADLLLFSVLCECKMAVFGFLTFGQQWLRGHNCELRLWRSHVTDIKKNNL